MTSTRALAGAFVGAYAITAVTFWETVASTAPETFLALAVALLGLTTTGILVGYAVLELADAIVRRFA